MTRMSKDYRSAGPRWSLPLSGAGLGGHGRPLGLFSLCFIFSITFCFSWCCRWFCGGVRREPMDNGKDQLPSSLFLVSIGAATDPFSGNKPWLLVNEENQPSLIIMKPGNLPHQSWKYTSSDALSSAPKEEGNGHHVGAIFPFFFWNILNLLMLLWQTWIWDLNGLGFFLGFGLDWWLGAISFISLLPWITGSGGFWALK